MEFGEKLRHAREAKGITQQTLANQLFVTRQAVSRWECGARFPDLLTAKKLSEYLEVSLDDLLSKAETEKCAEENPVIESPAIQKLQSALYGFNAMAFLLIVTFSLYLYTQTGNTDDPMLLYSLSLAVRRVSMMLFMFWGAALSIREKLSPKKAAILPLLFCVTQIITPLTSLFYMISAYGMYPAGSMLLRFVLYFLFPLLCMISVYRFFFLGKPKWRFSIYSYFLYHIVTKIISYIQARSSGIDTELGVLFGTLDLFAELAFAMLVLYQTCTLYIKRCRITSDNLTKN